MAEGPGGAAGRASGGQNRKDLLLIGKSDRCAQTDRNRNRNRNRNRAARIVWQPVVRLTRRSPPVTGHPSSRSLPGLTRCVIGPPVASAATRRSGLVRSPRGSRPTRFPISFFPPIGSPKRPTPCLAAQFIQQAANLQAASCAHRESRRERAPPWLCASPGGVGASHGARGLRVPHMAGRARRCGWRGGKGVGGWVGVAALGA